MTEDFVPMHLRSITGLSVHRVGADTCGIYFLVNQGEVVYVGQSNNVVARIEAQRTRKDFDSAAFVVVPRDRLDMIECAFIKVLRPTLNKHLIGSPTESDIEIVRSYGCSVPIAIPKESHTKRTPYPRAGWPDRIKSLRDKLGGLTQQEFADRIGSSQHTISNWERGAQTPRGPAVRMIEMLERERLTPAHPKEEG